MGKTYRKLDKKKKQKIREQRDKRRFKHQDEPADKSTRNRKPVHVHSNDYEDEDY